MEDKIDKVILADFSDTEKWGTVDFESVEKAVERYSPNDGRRLFLECKELSSDNYGATDFSAITHEIKDVTYDGGKIYGTLEPLDTPRYKDFVKVVGMDKFRIVPKCVGNGLGKTTILDIFGFNLVINQK